MSIDISRVVHVLRQACAAASYPLRPGPAEQLVAAALGYGTLASYQDDVKQQTEPRFLDEASDLILNARLLKNRAQSLAVSIPHPMLIDLAAGAFEAVLPHVVIHSSFGSFENSLIERLNDQAANGHETSGPMAMTNNDGIREIYLPFTLDLDAVQVGSSERIDIDGHVTMEPDIERPYSGHHIDVTAAIYFTRFGRQLLQDVRTEIEDATLSYDW